MGDVVNLRQARKARAKAEKTAAADANRLLFGRTKAERAAKAKDDAAARRLLDGHRLETPKGDD